MNHIKKYLVALCFAVANVSAAAIGNEPNTHVVAQESQPYLRCEVYPQWSHLTPQVLRAERDRALAEIDAVAATIVNMPVEETCWDNTFAVFSEALAPLEYVICATSMLNAVSSSDEYAALYVELNKDYVQIFHNERLWLALKNIAAQPWVAQLPPDRRRAVQQLCNFFERQGGHLPPSARERTVQIAAQLAELSIRYEQNIRKSEDAAQYHFSGKPSLLSGIPSRALKQARSNAKAQGYTGYLFLKSDGSLYAAMTLCRTEDVRKAAWEAWEGVNCPFMQENEEILHQFLSLLQEWASLNGASSYADLAAKYKMLPTGNAALAFIDDLMQRIKPAFDAEVTEMLRLYNAASRTQVQTLAPWDVPYAERLYYEAHPRSSAKNITDYFDCENVLQGALALCSTLYSVEFKERKTYCATESSPHESDAVEVWHPLVRCFDVYDKDSAEFLGIIYLDMFQRENKKLGAWAGCVRLGVSPDNGIKDLPHALFIIFNFNHDNRTLNHSEVCSVFHEFGHAMHNISGKHCITALNSPYVEQDFVEFPSTLSAYWPHHPEVLSTFSYHYLYGEPISHEQLTVFCRDSHKMSAMDLMSFLAVVRLDLEMNLFYEQKFKAKNWDAVSYVVLQPWLVPQSSAPRCCLLKTPHCVTLNYASGLYSYVWSDVLAADVFNQFEQSGVLNPALGLKYRRTILEKGASEPASDMLHNFLGRPPQLEPYLKYKGIIPSTDNH